MGHTIGPPLRRQKELLKPLERLKQRIPARLLALIKEIVQLHSEKLYNQNDTLKLTIETIDASINRYLSESPITAAASFTYQITFRKGVNLRG